MLGKNIMSKTDRKL